MAIKFTEEDILNAKEVWLYDNGILYIEDHNGNAYGYCQGGGDWFLKENFWDYFDSRMMMPYFSVPTKEEAVQLYRKWKNQHM